jgi:hypothetical protein
MKKALLILAVSVFTLSTATTYASVYSTAKTENNDEKGKKKKKKKKSEACTKKQMVKNLAALRKLKRKSNRLDTFIKKAATSCGFFDIYIRFILSELVRKNNRWGSLRSLMILHHAWHTATHWRH